MQLTYRGIHYNAAQTTTKTVDSGLKATYRGLSYALPQAQVWTPPAAKMPTKPMMYRGIVIGTPEVSYQPSARPAMA